MRIPDILKRAAELFADRIAVQDGSRTFRYADLAASVGSLAAFLYDQGIRQGDRVAILDVNSLEYLEAYFAASYLGAILVPLNYRLSPREIDFILQDSGASLTLVSTEFEPLLAGQRFVQMGDIDRSGLRAEPAPVKETDVAQLYYTSGTTGVPKGVMLTHRNVCTHALAAVEELQLTDGDVWAHVAPMFHLADAWATFAITWAGGVHVMIPRFEPEAVLSAFERNRINITNLVPAMLNQMVKHPKVGSYDYSSLRMILSGGAPIAPAVVREIIRIFRCEYAQTYGMTETSPYLTLSLLKGHLQLLPEEERLAYRCKTGRAFKTVDLKVVDGKGSPVKNDETEVGEIMVRGDTVTPGYWNRPEETRAAFENGWLKTGDLATIDPEGYVRIVDRKKDMILSGGENIYSVEVEHVLYLHPEIQEAAVFAVPDEVYGEAVKAAVVLKPGVSIPAEEIIRFCKGHLASYKAPKSIDFLEHLPRTGSGKLYKKALRDPYWQK